METQIEIQKVFHTSREVLFKFWIEPRLLEKWSSPRGLTLKVPYFHALRGGTYCFQHSGQEGTYHCEGHVKEIIPNEKLVQVDTVLGPKGELLFKNLESIITFSEVPEGTLITVKQIGFENQESKDSCEQSWNECFENLSQIISHPRFRPGQELREHQVRGY